jgi:hypothetical protein
MVKNILALSMVASMALFSVGCGGGGSDDTTQTQVDTTAPVFTNTTSRFTVTEETNRSVVLTATDESNVTFSIPAVDHFTLTGAKLTFSAPSYEDNASNEYNVTVKATDTAANSSQKLFSFKVEPKRAQITVVPVGDKNLTVKGDTIIGPAGLTWLNEDTDMMTYDEAVTYCADKGYRVARRDEILNLIDYSQGNGLNGRLLEEEFDKNSKSETWALKVNDVQFYINFYAGSDGIEPDDEDTNDEKSVLCVKGEPAPEHSFIEDTNTTVLDQSTGLKWTKIEFNHELRRAIVPDQDDEVQESAQESCPDGFTLPTITQLRSIVDYNANSINSDIAPAGVSLIWSNTEDPNNDEPIAKNYLLDTNKTIISTEEVSMTNFVTCVKAAE